MSSVHGERLSDEELMRRYQEGDHGALALLYERHVGVVLSHCQRMVRDWATAHDLTSDTFLRVMQKKVHFTPSKAGSFAAWLWKVTHNRCLNHEKSFAVSRSVPLEECPPRAATEMLKDPEFSAATLERAIEGLSDEQRVCIRLHYIDDLSPAEIVAQTGLSSGQVRSAIQNGKLRLRRVLQKGKQQSQ